MRSSVRLLVWVMLATGVGAPAWAERGKKRRPEAASPVSPAVTGDEPAPAESAAPRAPWQATAAGEKPVLSAYVFEAGAAPAAVQDAQAAVDGVLGAETQIRYQDLAELLEPPEEAQAAIAQASEQMQVAHKAFDEMDLERARQITDAALRAYERYLPTLVAEEEGTSKLRDAWIRAAAIRFLDGDSDGAREALRHVFPIDPKLAYSPRVVPPQMKKMFVESRLLFDALGTGKLEVVSEPAGATVFLNGKVRGTAPVSLDEVAAGPNYVTLVRRGFAPLTSVVEINGGGDQAKCEQTLSRFDDDPIAPLTVAQVRLGSLRVASGKRGQPAPDDAPSEVVDSARRLRSDLLVLVQLESGAAGIKVSGWLFDARPKKLLRRAEHVVAGDAISETAQRVARELVEGVRLDGVYVPPVAASGPGLFSRLGEALSAWRHSKYFWVGIAAIGAAVAIGVGVGLGVGLAPRQPTRPAFGPGEQVILLGGALSQPLLSF